MTDGIESLHILQLEEKSPNNCLRKGTKYVKLGQYLLKYANLSYKGQFNENGFGHIENGIMSLHLLQLENEGNFWHKHVKLGHLRHK